MSLTKFKGICNSVEFLCETMGSIPSVDFYVLKDQKCIRSLVYYQKRNKKIKRIKRKERLWKKKKMKNFKIIIKKHHK